MSNMIPKEQQSAYQRWELNSFNEERVSLKVPPPEPAAPRVTPEQLTAIRNEARQKGFEIGLEEGRAAGLEQGRAEAAQEAQRLAQIADTFGGEVAKADEAIAQDILDLALDLGKAMLKTALNIRPELVIPIVSEAIRYLPSLHQPALLFLNPDDAELVKTMMHDELTKAGWRVVEDQQIARGGCRIETASNQIDASTPSRWHRITEALNRDSDWLAP